MKGIRRIGQSQNQNPKEKIQVFEIKKKHALKSYGSRKLGSGKLEREYEMVLKKTLQSICLLNVHPNTTTSIVIQVVNDDGAGFTLLPCAINAACAALVDVGIPSKHLAVAICCCMGEDGHILLNPSKIEEQKVKAFVYLVFPNSMVYVLLRIICVRLVMYVLLKFLVTVKGHLVL